MISPKRSLRKILVSTGILATVVSIICIFSFQAYAVEDAKGCWVETNCVCYPGGIIVGNSNDCDPGTATCNDNNCSHTSCP